MNNIKCLVGNSGIIKIVLCMLWGVFLSLFKEDGSFWIGIFCMYMLGIIFADVRIQAHT